MPRLILRLLQHLRENSNHGNKCPRPGTAPAELMCIAEAMMPRLILRLLQHFRENSYRIAVQECEGYVQMLMEFNNMGDLMRSAMTKALINPQMYRNLIEPPFPETEYGFYMRESNKMYEEAIEMFPAPEPPDEYRDLPALAPRLTHHTLLDEFIFWTFKYEFPQNVEHLTRTFVMHYARIPLVLESANDPDTLSNRVVHMSVQLFSNEALALRCVQQLHLLHVMVLSLRLMMGKILVQNTLHDPDMNFHYVIDCTKRVMKEHCYWPLVSDFNNVLSHKSMNVNIRETGGHIEFEPSSYYAAFSCELEAAAYPMWSVLSHLSEPQHAPLARRMLAAALTHLQDWLDAVHFTAPNVPKVLHTIQYTFSCELEAAAYPMWSVLSHLSEPQHAPLARRMLAAALTHLQDWLDAVHFTAPNVMHASFHFPLHRYLAAFLCCGTRCMGLRAADVLPAADLLALLALHPLRLIMGVNSVASGSVMSAGRGSAFTCFEKS
ncbi:Ubiquitin ligase E3 [Operophtera brumata]|uniref:E3 ubiquitin-protein ligase n=1 Tax=Operophtera brumata TaxID=104452 RepID=A0A0L7KU12_OPEBR|nr:Ubiquitin ligase E3 [Operophtera brumata]